MVAFLSAWFVAVVLAVALGDASAVGACIALMWPLDGFRRGPTGMPTIGFVAGTRLYLV